MIRNKIDDDKITRIIKEPMNPYPEWIYRFFDAPWSKKSWTDLENCLEKKCKIRFRPDSFGDLRIHSWIFFKKLTLS